MAETLSNLGTPKVEATENTNVTGQMTSILDFSPIDGLEMVLKGIVDGKAGVPIYADLQDSAGNALPLDTDVVLRWDAPHLDQPQVVSFSLANIRQYRTLSIKEQQHSDYRDRTRHELKGSAVVVEDNESLEVAINSSAQIDWANSQLYIDENAVEVRSGN